MAGDCFGLRASHDLDAVCTRQQCGIGANVALQRLHPVAVAAVRPALVETVLAPGKPLHFQYVALPNSAGNLMQPRDTPNTFSHLQITRRVGECVDRCRHEGLLPAEKRLVPGCCVFLFNNPTMEQLPLGNVQKLRDLKQRAFWFALFCLFICCLCVFVCLFVLFSLETKLRNRNTCPEPFPSLRSAMSTPLLHYFRVAACGLFCSVAGLSTQRVLLRFEVGFPSETTTA